MIKLTGWTVDVIDETSSATLDWLLAIDSTVMEVQNEANKA